MNVVCPHCAATNRVPDARLADQPVCGKCKAALMPAEPFPLDDQSLPGYLAGTGLPVIVDFWAEWCGPCKMMAPQFAAAAAQLPLVRFVKIDSDGAPRASQQYGLRSIPTMILFQNGLEIDRLSGVLPAGDLVGWIRRHLPGLPA